MKLSNDRPGYSSSLHHLLTFTTLIVSLLCFSMFYSRIDKMNADMESILSISILKSEFLTKINDVVYLHGDADVAYRKDITDLYNEYVKRVFDADISSALKYEEEHFAENIYLRARDRDIHTLYADIGVDNNQFPRLAHSAMKQTREVYSRQLLILILIPTIMALLRSIQSVYYFYSLRRLRGNFMIDPLTGVYNRRYLSKLRDTQQVCYILAMDIDNFKNINDSWGHAFGDRVLQECSRQMTAHLRESDFVVRMGGDEFSIFLFKTDKKGAQRVSYRLLEMINAVQIPLPDDGSFTPSISMGLARCDGNVELALHQADLNLYASKKKGKNTLTTEGE